MIIHKYLPHEVEGFTFAASTVEEASIHARTAEGVVVHLKLRLGSDHPGHMAGSFEIDVVNPEPMPAPGDIVNVSLWQDVS